jgi:hypothetical protein
MKNRNAKLPTTRLKPLKLHSFYMTTDQTIECICDQCFKSATKLASQYFGQGTLGWWVDFSCKHCGKAYHLDGWGDDPAPEYIRQLVIRRFGVWSVRCKTEDRTMVCLILKKKWKLSLAETAILKKKIPGSIFEGTLAEAQEIVWLLKEVNVQSSLEQMGIVEQ